MLCSLTLFNTKIILSRLEQKIGWIFNNKNKHNNKEVCTLLSVNKHNAAKHKHKDINNYTALGGGLRSSYQTIGYQWIVWNTESI